LPVAVTGAQRASSVTARPVVARSVLARIARRPRPTRVATLAMSVLVLVATAAVPVLGSEPLEWESTVPAGIGTTLSPGDRVIDVGLEVVVPKPGETVWAALEYLDGTAQELQVVTELDGTVRLMSLGDDAVATRVEDDSVDLDLTPTSALETLDTRTRAECRSRDSHLMGWRTPVYRWYYSARTTPRKFTSRNNGQQQVIDALIRANRNVVRADNSCSRADRVSASFEYLGRTSRLPSARSNATCAGGDGRSVVGWGRLPRGILAYMCVHSMTSRRSRESDIKLNSNQPFDTKRSRCAGEFLIEATATHEFGHVYGLAHVRPLSLTMAPHVAWCSNAQGTLGVGDLIGLERKY
jgi:hypothetical protein